MEGTIKRNDRGHRVTYYKPHDDYLPDGVVTFRPVDFPGGTGVDVRDGQLVWGELARGQEGLLRYTPDQIEQFHPAVRMAVAAIASVVPMEHFATHDDWYIQVNNDAITVQFADWEGWHEFAPIVHELVEAVWRCLRNEVIERLVAA